MTIGGSDSGAGGGIQADLKTFFALGVYGSSVITAVTAQNTVEVAAIAEVPDEVVIAQIDTVAEDIGAEAVKTGMLVNQSIVQNVSDRLEAWGIPFLVVDPMMVSRSGTTLLQQDAIEALRFELIPQATIVTPNVSEAEVLSGRKINTFDDMLNAARAIHELGPEFVVIRGSDSSGPGIELVVHGDQFASFDNDRVDSSYAHGAGCTFSAAITAFLARGDDPLVAIRLAQSYVRATLAASYAIGSGHTPLNHAGTLPDELRSALAAHKPESSS